MNERLASRHIVLLGIGHTNAHVLRMYAMRGLPDTALTCISDHHVSAYSGMLPAVLAGQLPKTAMEIDLVKLCASVGARLITQRVSGLDPTKRQIHFEYRPPMDYDLLSIGVGSTAVRNAVSVTSKSVVELKPMQSFLERLQTVVSQLKEKVGDRSLRVAVAGSGAAGLEIAFCLPAFIKKHWSGNFSITLVTRSKNILEGSRTRTRQMALNEFQHRNVKVVTAATVDSLEEGRITFSNGETLDADVVIWSTGAAPPPILSQLGLATDANGFLLTRPTLQSVTNPHVFAVGDTGTLETQPTPKAGVYAVRQGPILWKNLQRSLAGEPLKPYRPQHNFMQLLNLGDGTAIGQWKSLTFSGRWVMRLKHSIDTAFMDKFQAEPMLDEEDPMQCRGCGCKVGADLLASALPAAGNIKFDDAAEIGRTEEHKIVASTDFFTSPFVDPFLTGRVAALHAASDIVASGAEAKYALSNVVIPMGPPGPQQAVLRELLAGAKCEFDAMDAAIVGGHTIEGPRLEIGFTVIGNTMGENLLEKRNLQVGDGLYVTKPIGIGVLLAAHMRSRCSAEDYGQLVDAMLERQHAYARLAIQSGIIAGTDITGFGLAGHLLEMLDASQTGACLQLDRIPVLPGACDAIAGGIQSSLAPSNRMAAVKIQATPDIRRHPTFDLLFDPQTCGGLLLGIADEQMQSLELKIADSGFRPLVRIGTVTASNAIQQPLLVDSLDKSLVNDHPSSK